MKCDSNVLAFFCPSANKQWLFITGQLQCKNIYRTSNYFCARHWSCHVTRQVAPFSAPYSEIKDLFLNRKISHVFPNDYRKIHFVTWRIFDGIPRTIYRQLNERGSFYNIQKCNFSLSTITTTRLFSKGSGEFSPSFHQNIS